MPKVILTLTKEEAEAVQSVLGASQSDDTNGEPLVSSVEQKLYTALEKHLVYDLIEKFSSDLYGENSPEVEVLINKIGWHLKNKNDTIADELDGIVRYFRYHQPEDVRCFLLSVFACARAPHYYKTVKDCILFSIDSRNSSELRRSGFGIVCELPVKMIRELHKEISEAANDSDANVARVAKAALDCYFKGG